METFTPTEQWKLERVKMRHGKEGVGYCWFCGERIPRSLARQEVRDETCVYVCHYGHIIDENCDLA